jgi:hypothetical protein
VFPLFASNPRPGGGLTLEVVDMAMSKPRGPAPKREADRRRANKPESQGEAQTVSAEAGKRPDELGFPAHEIVGKLWEVLAESAEAKFYSAADWQRVRLELFYANYTLTSDKIGAQAWTAVQAGLSELLISPADKRRAGIEMKPQMSDPDEDAAVVQLAEYQASLGA